MVSTDLNGLRLLAEWHEVKPETDPNLTPFGSWPELVIQGREGMIAPCE